MSYIVGVDLGGTNIACGLVNAHNHVVAELKWTTEALMGSTRVLHRIADMVLELLESNGLKSDAVEAIGVGIPGLINPAEGICISSSNLRWKNVKVTEQLEELLHIPVFIDNDVRMYVLGEALYGAGKEHRVVLGVTLGTGIAAALINEGYPFYGSKNIAGELGHIPMEGEEARCSCGMIGCLETVASATGLVRQALQLLAQGRTSILGELVSDPGLLTAAHISTAYDRGDAVAMEIMHHTGRTLGKALSYAIILYNPDVIIVGGGVAHAGDRILNTTIDEIQSRVPRMYTKELQIKTAEMDDRAGVIGSAVNASRTLQRQRDKTD